MVEDTDVWKRCNSCKKDIRFGSAYWVCSVSTCNRHPQDYVFCVLACWDAHVPLMRHRDAWAEERHAPSPHEHARAQAAQAENAPRRRKIVSTPRTSSEAAGSAGSKDILIVASKMKAYVRERAEMNTSADVLDRLSDLVRELCSEAIRSARRDMRKTVKARDFPRSLSHRDESYD